MNPPDRRAEPAPGGRRPELLRICGLAAVRARFQRNAASMLRLYFDQKTGRQVGVICRSLAAARKIYRCVEPAELEKIAGSLHHGGIVAVVESAPPRAATAADASAWVRRREPVVVLDRIGNAHNLGALARTAAFFGVPRLVISGDAAAARPGDAAYRVAEGGLEFVEVWRAEPLPSFLRALADAGFEVFGAAARGGGRLGEGKGKAAGASGRDSAGGGAPSAVEGSLGLARGAGKRPWALVLGNEEHGLSPEAAAACTRLITIGGGGAVESLNVSAAGAVLIHELMAGRPGRGR